MENIKENKLFSAACPLVLGSGSPRRKDMLFNLGLEFKIDPSKAEEPAPKPGQPPEEYVRSMARFKAVDVASRHEGEVVLTADTIVAIDNKILGKPASKAHAFEMLADLSGRTHKVLTGCALLGPGGRRSFFTATTEVDFIRLPPNMINAYIATGEPMDKAGGYGIQGVGSFLVREVRGSYTNVVGLPLARVLEVLLEWGVIVPRQG